MSLESFAEAMDYAFGLTPDASSPAPAAALEADTVFRLVLEGEGGDVYYNADLDLFAVQSVQWGHGRRELATRLVAGADGMALAMALRAYGVVDTFDAFDVADQLVSSPAFIKGAPIKAPLAAIRAAMGQDDSNADAAAWLRENNWRKDYE